MRLSATDLLRAPGTMAFDFHQHTTMKQYSKRNVSYSSKFELSNVVFTKK